jgi:hypothetical protein
MLAGRRTVSRCFAALRQLRTNVVRAEELFPVACCVACFVAPRLRQCDTRRTTGLPVSAASVCQGCWSAIDIRRWKEEPRDPLLRQLHWLRAMQRVILKMAMLVCQCIRGVASSYLPDGLHLVADMSGRCRLRSASTLKRVVPFTRLPTLGDRSLTVAAALLHLLLYVIRQLTSFFFHLHIP